MRPTARGAVPASAPSAVGDGLVVTTAALGEGAPGFGVGLGFGFGPGPGLGLGPGPGLGVGFGLPWSAGGWGVCFGFGLGAPQIGPPHDDCPQK
jgi:hypothetical protein